MAEELALVGVPAREDPADAFVGEADSLDELPEGDGGHREPRRRSQLLAVRPDLDVVEVRGNVDTRLRKLAEGELDGIVLAVAGLRRLGREGEIAFRFGADVMVPAPGQGALMLQARTGDAETATAAGVSDRESLVEFTAERAATGALEATCDTPLGLCARHMDGTSRWRIRRVAGRRRGPRRPARRPRAARRPRRGTRRAHARGGRRGDPRARRRGIPMSDLCRETTFAVLARKVLCDGSRRSGLSGGAPAPATPG